MAVYKKPQQLRASLTENKFLTAFENLLRSQSFGYTTIDQIALEAGLNRGAFLKRFGSKINALLFLYHEYCLTAQAEVRRILANKTGWVSAQDVCIEASTSLELIQVKHFGCNRAMHEHFMESLETDDQTKNIFLATVELMRNVQSHFFQPSTFSDSGAYAATQLLVSINYNYVLNAMPALPKDCNVRHKLIAECMLIALQL